MELFRISDRQTYREKQVANVLTEAIVVNSFPCGPKHWVDGMFWGFLLFASVVSESWLPSLDEGSIPRLELAGHPVSREERLSA